MILIILRDNEKSYRYNKEGDPVLSSAFPSNFRESGWLYRDRHHRECTDRKFVFSIDMQCTFCFAQELAVVGSILENVTYVANIFLYETFSQAAGVRCVFNFYSSFHKLSAPVPQKVIKVFIKFLPVTHLHC